MAVRMGRLVLSRLEDDFDPSLDVVYGPWCFLGREAEFPGWEDLPMDEAFASPEEVAEHGKLVHQLTLALIDERAAELNARHGVQFSNEFWRYLLFIWLYTLADAAWVRWRVAEKLITRCGDRALDVTLREERAQWDVADTRAVMLLISQNRDFDYWLSSRIIATMAPPQWRLRTEPGTAGTGPLEEVGVGLFSTSPLRRLARRVFPFPRCHRVLGMGASSLVLSLYMCLLPRRPLQRVDVFPPPPGIMERFPAGFVAALRAMADATLPHAFGAGFSRLLAESRKLVTPVPGSLRMGCIDFSCDSEKLPTALAMEGGERFVSAQHGGTYGITQCMPMVFNQEFATHGLQTWGWTRHGDVPVRTYPLPSPFLSKLRNRHREQDSRIILVGNWVRLEFGSIWSPPLPLQALAYRRRKRDFLLALPPHLHTKVAYRPYKRAYAEAEDEAYLRRTFPDLTVLDGDLLAALLRVRLAVLDHPGTTLPIAMAANVPTICFWNPAEWTATPQADAVFEHLRRAGIVHHDHAAAAAKVEAVWGDVQGWWQSREVQDARRLFCHHYARSSPVWWWHWLTGLARMAADRPNPN